MKIITIVFMFLFALSSCSMQASKSIESELLGNWRIEMIKDKPVIDYSPASLRFAADNILSANASCNNMASTYSVSGNSLTLNVGAVTRKMCPGALMDQESRFLAALPDIRTGRTQDGMLYLQGEGGELIFKAAPIKE